MRVLKDSDIIDNINSAESFMCRICDWSVSHDKSIINKVQDLMDSHIEITHNIQIIELDKTQNRWVWHNRQRVLR